MDASLKLVFAGVAGLILHGIFLRQQNNEPMQSSYPDEDPKKKKLEASSWDFLALKKMLLLGAEEARIFIYMMVWKTSSQGNMSSRYSFQIMMTDLQKLLS